MAAAIANAEIAARMRVSMDKLQTVNVRALSAGVAARVGEPLTAEAQDVLHLLNVPVQPHAARNLTPDLAQQAEMIFCMTTAVREAVIQMLPAVANKTYCLDTASDIPDPIGKGMDAYLNCARRIHDLVRLRFDELDLKAA
jgi:protein-tyrosine phosphatase